MTGSQEVIMWLRSASTSALDWLGYQLLMHGPDRLVLDAKTPLGRWCLERAGGHAYRGITQEKT